MIHFFHFIAVGKKLKALSKDKKCEELIPWHQSIINHLYWSAVSTPLGEGETIVAKWQSVERHVQNLHRGHGDIFPKCAHGRLRGHAAKKKWLKPS